MVDHGEDLETNPDPEEPWSGRVAFAQIEAFTLHATVARDEALQNALVPGTRVERHNRTWRMGQVRMEGASLVGRIGFETGNLAEVWDDEINDFKEQLLQAGTTSPFAINPADMRVAFQLRPGLIRVRSFTGALQTFRP